MPVGKVTENDQISNSVHLRWKSDVKVMILNHETLFLNNSVEIFNFKDFVSRQNIHPSVILCGGMLCRHQKFPLNFLGYKVYHSHRAFFN